MVKVFLVDDHEVVRRGLCDLLSSDPDLQIVGEAGTVAEAKARIRRRGPTWPCSTCGCPTATASSCAATCSPSIPTCAA